MSMVEQDWPAPDDPDRLAALAATLAGLLERHPRTRPGDSAILMLSDGESGGIAVAFDPDKPAAKPLSAMMFRMQQVAEQLGVNLACSIDGVPVAEEEDDGGPQAQSD